MTSRMQETQAAAGNVAAPSVITIDRTSPIPLYFQLAQHFEAAIRSGALKVGSRLDNEVQLAERLGLSRPTVRAAFQYLSNKGLVVRKRGAGTLCTAKRTVTEPATSIAVPQTSPSPCAKWRSPIENSAPGTSTGSHSFEPATSWRTSMLPPVSRGGIVRMPSAAVAGSAASGIESATGCPASRSSSSRAR